MNVWRDVLFSAEENVLFIVSFMALRENDIAASIEVLKAQTSMTT